MKRVFEGFPERKQDMEARVVLQSSAVAQQAFIRPSGRRVLLLSSLLRHGVYGLHPHPVFCVAPADPF